MRLLVFNAGSSSLKFDLMEVRGGEPARLASGAFVERGDGALHLGHFIGGASIGTPPAPGALRTLAEAAERVLEWLADPAKLDATVHRIVHGGEAFRQTSRLGETELAVLAGLATLAPLHNPPALAVIATVRSLLGAA